MDDEVPFEECPAPNLQPRDSVLRSSPPVQNRGRGLWPIHSAKNLSYMGNYSRAKLQASVKRCNFVLDSLEPDSERVDSVLKELLRTDDNLKTYLSAHDGDPHRALLAAQADAMYLAELPERETDEQFHLTEERDEDESESTGTLRSIVLERLLIPIVLVLCTAIVGNYVADSLQRRAFERQKSFEARLEDVREARTRAAKLVSDVEAVFPFIKARERFGGRYDYREKLRGFLKELDFQRTIAEGMEEQVGYSKAVVEAREAVSGYLSCMEERYKSMETADLAAPCSEGFDQGSLELVRRNASRVAASVGND